MAAVVGDKRLPCVPYGLQTPSDHDRRKLTSSRRRDQSSPRGNASTAGRNARRHPPSSFRVVNWDAVSDVDHAHPLHSRLPSDGGRRNPSFSPAGQATPQSLVDSMVSSLDRYDNYPTSPQRRSLSTRSHTADDVPLYRTYSAHGDDVDPAMVSSRFSLVRPSRPRGHTYSASYSSDYDLSLEPPTTRHSALASRERRSNSGSNVHVVLERIESLRCSDKERGRVFDTQRAAPPSSRQSARDRSVRPGIKSSKSSASSSFDGGYVQVYGSTRWATAIGQRSSSFDRERALHTSPSDAFPPAVDFSPASPPMRAPDFLDAAPTPVVHAGPSRQHSPVRLDAQPLAAPRHPLLGPISTKVSPRSARGSVFSSDSKQEAAQPAYLYASSVSPGQGAKVKRLPALPATSDVAAPGPTVSFGKQELSASPASTLRAKDRPGFFRRVFGSSSSKNNNNNNNNNNSTAVSAQPRPPPLTNEAASAIASALEDNRQAVVRSVALQYQAEADKVLPPSPLTHAPAPAPPPLAKKTSFFWRRKRSISEGRVRPFQQPAAQSPVDADVMGQSLSPASSLRKVMDPYIVDGGAPSGRGVHGAPPVHSDGGIRANEKFWNEQVTAPEALLAQTDAGRPMTSEPTSTRGRLRDRCPFTGGSLSPPLTSPHADAAKYRRLKSQTLQQERSKSDPSTFISSGDGETTPSTPPDLVQTLSKHTLADSSAVQTPAAGPGPFLGEHALPVMSLEPESLEAPPVHADAWISAAATDEADPDAAPASTRPVKANRIWLEPSSSEEHLPRRVPSVEQLDPATPMKAAAQNEAAESAVVGEASTDAAQRLEATSPSSPLSSSADLLEPDSRDQDVARELFEGRACFLGDQPVAAWLGEPGVPRARIRRAYAALFNWTNFTILSAMRELCQRLVLKAETQQVDRILDAISARWCECNPNHGFIATDVVHTICYSILLLNTDLYLADIEQKMTRAQFIKNTMPTIRRVAVDAAPDAFDRPQSSFKRRSRTSSVEPMTAAAALLYDGRPAEAEDPQHLSADFGRPTRKLSRSIHRSDDSRARSPTPAAGETPSEDNAGLVAAPAFYGSKKSWENQVELVLKDIYTSIKRQQLPAAVTSTSVEPASDVSSNTLAVTGGNVLKRTPSTLSKAHSENMPPRGRPELQRRGSTARWGSKTRNRPKLYPSSTLGSSRTSIDEQLAVWTPTSPYAWSKYSLSKTQTSVSISSVRSPGFGRQSVGFAGALNQAFVRDDATTSSVVDDSTLPLLEDETLGLAGAPWAKEGIVQHKHHLDSMDRRAKDRNWNECFAVVSKGYMRLYSFASKGNSVRQRNKHLHAGVVVGGGNWTENADALGSFLLRQTIASALPAPGYSKARPYVWALSFPTGAVHLFQAGTPEIVHEFVSTANYWSARLSKEPVVGGISNVEYGWSDAVINAAFMGADSTTAAPPPPHSSSGARPSLQGSMRSSSMDQAGNSARISTRLPGDRVIISEWSAPQQSMVASRLSEADQLQALITYVKNIEMELQKHNELRGAMLLAFSTRHGNYNRAMANWERKSSYLLREIVKFRTYIDSLAGAQKQGQLLRRTQEVVAAVAAGPADGQPQQEQRHEQEASEGEEQQQQQQQPPVLPNDRDKADGHNNDDDEEEEVDVDDDKTMDDKAGSETVAAAAAATAAAAVAAEDAAPDAAEGAAGSNNGDGGEAKASSPVREG